MCPSICKHGAVAPIVVAARPVAITGDVSPKEAGIPEPRRVDFGDDDANRSIARLLVVELDDVQVLPTADKSLAMTPLSLARGFVAIIDGLLASAGA